MGKSEDRDRETVTVSKKKIDELYSTVEEHTKVINKIYERVFYAEELTNLLEEHKRKNHMSAYSYGQNLSWILCSTITSYRGIQLGAVSSGGSIASTGS